MTGEGHDEVGIIKGKYYYMSPEQANGAQAGSMGPPTDVYGLGAVLFALLTNRGPYVGSALAVMTRVLEGNPKPPSSACSGVPPALNAIFEQATRLSPADRYPDGAAMRDDLDRFLAGESPLALRQYKGRRAAALFALLAILQVMSLRRRQNGRFDLKSFKIVYIDPMKALVSEIVGNF